MLATAIDEALAADADSDRRRRAIDRLQRRHDHETFDAALALCRSGEPRRRVLGIEILAQFGYVEDESERPFRERTIRSLLELAETERSVPVLRAIGTAFGHLHDARAIDLLVRLAGNRSEVIRLGAVEGLLGHDDDRAVDALVTLSTDSDTSVRDWATFGLGSMIARDTLQVRDALMARSADADPDTRGEALVGLAARGDQRAIEPLLRELEEYEGTLLDEALELLMTHTDDHRLRDAASNR